jgi:cell division septal protein FtsQ
MQRTSEADVLHAAALPSGRNVWLLNTAAAEEQIRALPWIRTARIDRGWPNIVTIAVDERQPVARLALASPKGRLESAVIDQSLRVLAVEAEPGPDEQLPLLSVSPQPQDARTPGETLNSPETAQALETAQRLASYGVRLSEIESTPARGIAVVTPTHLRVLFGTTDDLERKVDELGAIIKRIAHPDEVAYVDLRSAAAPTVMYR